MNASRLVHVVNGVLLLLLFGGSLWVYPTLPEQIPRHFGLYGQADAYWQATLVHWLLLPVVALVSAVALYGPAGIVRAVPSSWINVPNQAQYDALPPVKKRAVMSLVQRALYWMTTATLVVFLAVQGSVFYVATTAATALPVLGVGAMAVALLAIAGLTGWLVWRLPKRIQTLSGSPDESGGADLSLDDG